MKEGKAPLIARQLEQVVQKKLFTNVSSASSVASNTSCTTASTVSIPGPGYAPKSVRIITKLCVSFISKSSQNLSYGLEISRKRANGNDCRGG